jgi:hypothetical protein
MNAVSVINDFCKNNIDSDSVEILPGLGNDEIQKYQNVNNLKPEQYQEVLALVMRSTGISMGYEFDFTGLLDKADDCDLGCSENVVYNAVDIGTDGSGNRWVVEINDGVFENVLFLCHDPSVIAYEASGVTEFIGRALNNIRSKTNWIGSDDGSWYKENGGGVVNGDLVYFDLRSHAVGHSVPLCLYYDSPDMLKRHGRELLFSMPHKNRNWWQKFRDKWR